MDKDHKAGTVGMADKDMVVDSKGDQIEMD